MSGDGLILTRMTDAQLCSWLRSYGGDELRRALYHAAASVEEATARAEKVEAVLTNCVEALAGYRRELGDNQPCDAERAAIAILPAKE